MAASDHGSHNDIFTGRETVPPLPTHQDHPVSQEHIFPHSAHPGVERRFTSQPQTTPQTNKFYANLLLGGQSNPCWTHPYMLAWAKGSGNARSCGIGVSHTERHQLALGGKTPSGAVQYFLNPVGIQSLVLSAHELGSDTRLTLDNLQASSVNVQLSKASGSPPIMTLPLVQGMGFVTALYQNATPLLQSSVFFRSFSAASPVNNGSTSKFKTVLEDGCTWLTYATPCAAFKQLNNTTISGPASFKGIVQVAKIPQGAPEDVYDSSAGAYASTCTVSASVGPSFGHYSFSWHKEGADSRPLLMYALPHHMESFDEDTTRAKRPISLQTTTKGIATAVLADHWTMVERVPIDMQFAPWHPEKGSVTSLSYEAVVAINNAAKSEIQQDYNAQTNLDSMYFSGKGLAKFAMMIYATHDLARNPDLARTGLAKLKTAFAVFVQNKQKNPLVYNSSWRTAVSTAGLGGDAGADFGNSFCNDHHFHYGYFLYTAAVIGYLDPSWLQGADKAFVDMLARDFASPTNDQFFPFSRSFDMYHGHSWAKGLFESGDGKDQESTSEDSFASYSLEMWGKISGDRNMEARGALMLAIQARSFRHYFLMESDNKDQPPQFLNNKVTGILFENKVDHATYFGMNIEYIQGIHMIPLSPVSVLTRSRNFVKEEWETYFSRGRVDEVGGGWRGILYANLGLIDPKAAFRFFNQPNFDPGWLDGGASRTWYLAFSAALGGA